MVNLYNLKSGGFSACHINIQKYIVHLNKNIEISIFGFGMVIWFLSISLLHYGSLDNIKERVEERLSLVLDMRKEKQSHSYKKKTLLYWMLFLKNQQEGIYGGENCFLL